MRLNKYLAHGGVGTRRQADGYIINGKISIDGKVITNPAYKVSDHEVVTFNGKQVTPKKEYSYILMNKPKMFTCEYDLENNKSISKLIRNKYQNKVAVPLPLRTEDRGLIILTDDDEVIEKMKSPDHTIKQLFEITLDKPLELKDIDAMTTGLEIGGVKMKVKGISPVTGKEPNIVGVESEVNSENYLVNFFNHQGYKIKVLDRTYIAGLTKKDLPRGFFRNLTKKEVIFLKHFL